MNTIRTILTAFIITLFTGTLAQTSPTRETITMTVPDIIINDVIQKSLPVEIPIQSKTLLGSVSIDAIKNLQLKKGSFSGHITLSGHQLNLVTSIAGHDLRMKIGSLTMAFQCDATIRFDSKSQTLFLKPVITDMQSDDKAKTEVTSLISQLFNNREFPLQQENLQPIIADLGDKLLHIAMQIDNIDIQPGLLHLQVRPQITTTTKQKTSSTQ